MLIVAFFCGVCAIGSKLALKVQYHCHPSNHTRDGKEDVDLFENISNETKIEYHDCMPDKDTIKAKGWENPNFWARFPYWNDRKQLATAELL